jgi:hypothetical protein
VTLPTSLPSVSRLSGIGSRVTGIPLLLLSLCELLLPILMACRRCRPSLHSVSQLPLRCLPESSMISALVRGRPLLYSLLVRCCAVCNYWHAAGRFPVLDVNYTPVSDEKSHASVRVTVMYIGSRCICGAHQTKT